MPSKLELSVILTTFQRPRHLERSLASLALQRGMSGRFEVVVADDGSKDRTHDIVHKFAKVVDFPLKLVTHAHRGFRVALCRNDGVRASSAPYILFSHSDCLFPTHHLEKHLLARRPNVVRVGHCLRLGQVATERVDMAAIESGAYRNWVSREERQRLMQKWFKEQYYRLVCHPAKPKLVGWNVGIWRRDVELVNGFDEMFVGWGCEDDDVGDRLRQAGVRITSAVRNTNAYHMWHPTDPTRAGKWNEGPNVERLMRLDRPIRCPIGLETLPGSEIDEMDAGVEHARRELRQTRHAA